MVIQIITLILDMGYYCITYSENFIKIRPNLSSNYPANRDMHRYTQTDLVALSHPFLGGNLFKRGSHWWLR